MKPILDLRSTEFAPTPRGLAAAMLRALGADEAQAHTSTEVAFSRAIAVVKSRAVKSIVVDHRRLESSEGSRMWQNWENAIFSIVASGIEVHFATPVRPTRRSSAQFLRRLDPSRRILRVRSSARNQDT